MHKQARWTVWALFVVLAALPLSAVYDGPATERDNDFLILLTNDDGYDAPGLKAMVETFAPNYHVVAAGPAEQQSGVSNAITYREPIFVRKVNLVEGVDYYSVTAFPATCARIGIESLSPRRPDLVISGINSSENLGGSVLLSGTVGAARQAAMAGVPSIAVSRGRGADYHKVAETALQLVRQLREEGKIEPGLFLNVNVPADPKGFRIVRQSMARDTENYERRVNPRGFVYYWSNWTPPKETSDATDIGAFAQGYVTITPLKLDQTDGGAMAAFGTLESLPTSAN